MAIHEILSARRRERKISIDSLVEMSGVPKGTLTKIMTGITENPGIETLKAIAYPLGLTLEDLDEDKRPADMGGPETPEEERFVWLYRQLGDEGVQVVNCYLSLSPSNRRLLFAIAQAIQREQGTPASPDP